MQQIKAVIIDDLADSRAILNQDLLDYCPIVKVVGEADGVVAGLKLLKNTKVDLIFLDINMNDGSGFDLLEVLDDNKIKIIFTTASDLYAIKAFKFSAVDYLLKPIDIDELVKAVNKVATTSASNNFELLKSNLTAKEVEKIALHTADKIHICSINEIVRCESNVNYTTFFFADGSNKMVTKTLKYFDQILTDSGFFRVHQSHLINIQFVKEYVKSEGGYLRMKDDSIVPISSRKKAEILAVVTSI